MFAGCALGKELLGEDFRWAWPENWADQECGKEPYVVDPQSDTGYVLLLRIVEACVAAACFDPEERSVTEPFATIAASWILPEMEAIPVKEGLVKQLLVRA